MRFWFNILRLIVGFYCYDYASTNKSIFVCAMKLSGQLGIPRVAVTKQVDSGGKDS